MPDSLERELAQNSTGDCLDIQIAVTFDHVGKGIT